MWSSLNSLKALLGLSAFGGNSKGGISSGFNLCKFMITFIAVQPIVTINRLTSLNPTNYVVS